MGRDELFHSLTNLIVRAIRSYRIPFALRSDAYQEGAIGLLDAIDKCTNPQTLPAFAYARIRGRLITWMRETNAEQKGLSQAEVRRDYHQESKIAAMDEEEEFEDDSHSVIHELIRLEEIRGVRECVARVSLTVKETAVLERHLMGDDSLEAIAHDQGCSRQAIHITKKRVVEKIRPALRMAA